MFFSNNSFRILLEIELITELIPSLSIFLLLYGVQHLKQWWRRIFKNDNSSHFCVT